MSEQAWARDRRPYRSHRHQLYLPLDSLSPPPACAARKRSDSALILQELLRGDLDFQGHDSRYASHNFHAFAAKFPPQLPRLFIERLTQPGETVLDPMVGSGTTLVEAVLLGRRAIGFDVDPLALRLCRVKTVPLEAHEVSVVGAEVVKTARELFAEQTEIQHELATRFDPPTTQFLDSWFLPRTQQELMALKLALERVPRPSVRDFLEVVFSSIIITKSGGVSLARDLAHSRPHRDRSKVPKEAIEQFDRRLYKNLESVAELPDAREMVHLQAGDARTLNLPDETVDLVVTSPPYANAIDYMRAHKFSLVWFGQRITDLGEHRATYIGSERCGQGLEIPFPEKTQRVIGKVAEKDPQKAKILRKYYGDMQKALGEMHRVLRPGKAAVMVVGSSTMRGVNTETEHCLADLAAAVGFEVVGVATRRIDRDKRMMPARWGRKSGSMIEERMHEEGVIGLGKPAPARWPDWKDR